MTSANQFVQQTYRFKFSENFRKHIHIFAQINKNVDDKYDWDNNFDKWKHEKIQYILEEQRRLSNLGYVGDIQCYQGKIYKSARYYFKNKEINNNNKPKKRRVYVSLERDLLDAIDDDIDNIMNSKENTNNKPQNAYIKFINNTKYITIINTEKDRLSTKKIENKEINYKIKKTYKNRYYTTLHK